MRVDFNTKYITNIHYRPPLNLPAWFLRIPRSEEVVGAVLQATMARQYRHLPEGAGDGGAGGPGQDGEEDGGEGLPPLLYSLHKKAVSSTA